MKAINVAAAAAAATAQSHSSPRSCKYGKICGCQKKERKERERIGVDWTGRGGAGHFVVGTLISRLPGIPLESHE